MWTPLTTEAGIWFHKDGTCRLSFKLMKAAVKFKTLPLVLAAEITFAGHEMDSFLGLNKSHIRLIDIQWVVTLINYNLKCHKMQIIQSALLPAQFSAAFYLHQMIPNGLPGHQPYLTQPLSCPNSIIQITFSKTNVLALKRNESTHLSCKLQGHF